MSTPRDGHEPNPFAPRPDDENSSGQQSSHPAPPPMSSPYGAPLSNSESNSGGSAQRQPPRFPQLNQPASGADPASGARQGPPPFVSPSDDPLAATIPP